MFANVKLCNGCVEAAVPTPNMESEFDAAVEIAQFLGHNFSFVHMLETTSQICKATRNSMKVKTNAL